LLSALWHFSSGISNNNTGKKSTSPDSYISVNPKVDLFLKEQKSLTAKKDAESIPSFESNVEKTIGKSEDGTYTALAIKALIAMRSRRNSVYLGNPQQGTEMIKTEPTDSAFEYTNTT
jgi:hypothetical protein